MSLGSSLDPEVVASRGSRYRLTLLPRPDLPVAERTSPEQRQARSGHDRYRRLVLSGDAGGAVLACLLTEAIRFGHGGPPGRWVLTMALPAAWLGLLTARGAYRGRALGHAAAERSAVVVAGAVLVALAGTASYLLAAPLSRMYLLVSAAGAVLGSLTVREVLRRRLYRARRQGKGLARVLVVGHAASAGALVEALDGAPESGLVAVAACLPSDGVRVSPPHGIPLAADVAEVLASMDDLQVDAVALASDLDISGLATRLLADAVAARGVDLLVHTSTAAAAWVPGVEPVDGLPLVQVAVPSAAGTSPERMRGPSLRAGIPARLR